MNLSPFVSLIDTVYLSLRLDDLHPRGPGSILIIFSLIYITLYLTQNKYTSTILDAILTILTMPYNAMFTLTVLTIPIIPQ